MPELPEVEVTRCGLIPHVVGRCISRVVVRRRDLRQAITRSMATELENNHIHAIRRRGKYLLFDCERGTLLLHLGMSGSLRVLKVGTPPTAHDHVDWVFESGTLLRFRDVRRFGLILWITTDPLEHELLIMLGPEPLSDQFHGDYLYEKSKGRKTCVKNFLMDARTVAGVGNIYANEALFAGGVHPLRQAGKISRKRYVRLVEAIREVLTQALRAGGTSLRDFVRENSEPGYFQRQLRVYARAGEPCVQCGKTLKRRCVSARSTFYCVYCQR